MIKVIVFVKSNRFNSVRIEGHAAYAQKGSDIVCAGVSSIVEGTESFFKNNYQKEIIVCKDRLGVNFSVVENEHEGLQICLQMFIHQLRNISFFYPNYVKIFC